MHSRTRETAMLVSMGFIPCTQRVNDYFNVFACVHLIHETTCEKVTRGRKQNSNSPRKPDLKKDENNQTIVTVNLRQPKNL